MGRKDVYIEKLEARLDQWRSKIDLLESRADEAEADARITYLDQVRQLKRRQQQASEKLEELKQAGESTMEVLKSGVEEIFEDLGRELEKTVENL